MFTKQAWCARLPQVQNLTKRRSKYIFCGLHPNTRFLTSPEYQKQVRKFFFAIPTSTLFCFCCNPSKLFGKSEATQKLPLILEEVNGHPGYPRYGESNGALSSTSP